MQGTADKSAALIHDGIEQALDQIVFQQDIVVEKQAIGCGHLRQQKTALLGHALMRQMTPCPHRFSRDFQKAPHGQQLRVFHGPVIVRLVRDQDAHIGECLCRQRGQRHGERIRPIAGRHQYINGNTHDAALPPVPCARCCVYKYGLSVGSLYILNWRYTLK